MISKQSIPELISRSYTMADLPKDIITIFKNLTETIYHDILTKPGEIINFHHESPVEGFKQRKNQQGTNTAMVWILPVAGNGSYHLWQNDPTFLAIKDYITQSLDTICDRENVSSQRMKFIAINYYPPQDIFDASNPIFPYHTDFGYINCLLSNGPTMILDPSDKCWKEINLGNRMMFQVGGSLQATNGTYSAIPHGVGRSPVIVQETNLGKISIVGVTDPLGQITLQCGSNSINIDGMEMIGIRFRGMYGEYLEFAQEKVGYNYEQWLYEKELYETYLQLLNDFPRPN